MAADADVSLMGLEASKDGLFGEGERRNEALAVVDVVQFYFVLNAVN